MAKPKSAFFCFFALICVFFGLLNFAECKIEEMEQNEDVLKPSANKFQDWTTAQYIAQRDSRNPGCYRLFITPVEKHNENQNVVQLRHLDVDADKQIDSDAYQNAYGASTAEKDPMDKMGRNRFADLGQKLRNFLGFDEESGIPSFFGDLRSNFNDDQFKKSPGLEVTKIDNFNYLLKFQNDVPLDKVDLNVDLPKRLIVVNEDKSDEAYSSISEVYKIRFSALAEISNEDIELGRLAFSLNEEEGTIKISFPKKTSIEEDEGSAKIIACQRISSSESPGFLNRRRYSYEVESNLNGNGTDNKSTK